MKTLRTALLVAAVMTVVPTVAYAQDQNPRHDHGGDRGNGGGNNGGGDHARPTPPQAAQPQAPHINAPLQAGNNGAPSPRANWGGGQPAQQAQPQPQHNEQRGDGRGGWQGNGGQWQGNRPVPPQGMNAAQGWQNRGQDHRDDNRNGGNAGRPNGGPANDDRRGDNRGPNNGGDHRWDNNDRGNGYGGNDRRPDTNGRAGYDNRYNGSHQWNGNNNGRANEGRNYRLPNANWRNDHRYDWHDYRDSHRDLFRSRYYGPRGYNYRSVYRGFYLEPLFYGSSYWLADPYEYRLPPVDWPLRWVRYYNDALLVDVTSGEVVDVIQGFFW